MDYLAASLKELFTVMVCLPCPARLVFCRDRRRFAALLTYVNVDFAIQWINWKQWT
jgi:hypothetical protein